MDTASNDFYLLSKGELTLCSMPPQGLWVIYIIKGMQGRIFVPDTLISLTANYSGFHTSSQADSLCLLYVVFAWWRHRSKKAVTT